MQYNECHCGASVSMGQFQCEECAEDQIHEMDDEITELKEANNVLRLENDQLRLQKNNLAKIIVDSKIKLAKCNCMYSNIHPNHYREVTDDELS